MVYEYDWENKLIKVDNETIYLTNVENIIFEELYYTGKPVSAEKLNDKLNNGYMFRENSITVAITRLRKKLGNKFEIKNISGRGYIIEPNELDVEAKKLVSMFTNKEDEEDIY